MILRKGSGREAKVKLQNYRNTRDSILAREESKERYYKAKRKREEKNKNALLFYIETLKKEFGPKDIEMMFPVFDSWKKRKYAREATLAHYDIRKVLAGNISKDELEEKLNSCQEKLRLRIVELQEDE